MDSRNFIKRAAKELPRLTDLVLQSGKDLTPNQMWTIALGYTNMADAGQNPMSTGWNDWLEFGRQLEDYPIKEIE